MNFFKKIFLIHIFMLQYFWDLTLSAFKIAFEVITVKDYRQPGIIEIDLDVKSKWEIMTFANLITFSPGTLVADISEDGRKMSVHCLFLDDPEEMRSELKDQLEKRVIQLFRGSK